MSNRHSTSIRLPNELRAWAETRSIRNYRSLSAEIVAILTAVRCGEIEMNGFERLANPSHIPGSLELFHHKVGLADAEKTADV